MQWHMFNFQLGFPGGYESWATKQGTGKLETTKHHEIIDYYIWQKITFLNNTLETFFQIVHHLKVTFQTTFSFSLYFCDRYFGLDDRG